MNLILFYNKILYKKIIKICAWCPGKDEKDKKAKKIDMKIIHWIYEECSEKTILGKII